MVEGEAQVGDTEHHSQRLGSSVGPEQILAPVLDLLKMILSFGYQDLGQGDDRAKFRHGREQGLV